MQANDGGCSFIRGGLRTRTLELACMGEVYNRIEYTFVFVNYGLVRPRNQVARKTMKTAQQVYDELVAYMAKFTDPKRSWYAGIAATPRDRLFIDHSVPENGGYWAYRTCQTSDDARAVEEALLKLGCKGGGGGGDHTTKSCYVYFITSDTRE